MQKHLFALLLVAMAVPSFLKADPITYTLRFNATGTFTPKASGSAPVPINGPVVLLMQNDTSNVKTEGDGDGDPIGFQTSIATPFILVPGVVAAESTPIAFLSPYGGSNEELFQEQLNPLSLTIVFALASGGYDLKTNISTDASVIINYFNMGELVTSKGTIQLNPQTVNGTFTGRLKQ